MNDNKFPVSPEELDQAVTQPVVSEVKQVAQEVGQALEIGAQSTTDPQAQAKKQQEEAQKTSKAKKYWQNFLSKFVQDEQKLKMAQQQQAQQLQQVTQENKQKIEIKQFEKRKKEESFEQQHVKGIQAKAERQKNIGG